MIKAFNDVKEIYAQITSPGLVTEAKGTEHIPDKGDLKKFKDNRTPLGKGEEKSKESYDNVQRVHLALSGVRETFSDWRAETDPAILEALLKKEDDQEVSCSS